MNIPFYYRLSFNGFAYNSPDDIKQKSVSRDFKNQEPILARMDAFSEFEEYLNWFKELGRLQQTKDNYILAQPDYITKPIRKKREILDKLKKEKKDYLEDLSAWADWYEVYEKYQEELRIDIVFSEEAREITSEEEEAMPIHMVSSNNYDPDDLLCGGLLVEVELYEHYGFDTKDFKTNIEYYGTDYYQAGDDPEAGKYVILKTPRRWISEIRMVEEAAVETKPVITHEEIIARGEGKNIEFKPALVYNFKTGEAGIGVKYIVAKGIAAFLNAEGGLLYIGVNDKGAVQGLKADYSVIQKENKRDGLKSEFDDLMRQFFKPFVTNYIKTEIIEIQNKEVFVIRAYPSKQPVFLKNRRGETTSKEFYYRTQEASELITDVEDIIDYVFNNKNFLRLSDFD